MSSRLAENERRPIADLNTTPLIDVMLVLLIMFIITMPMATHAVKVDMPGTEKSKKQPTDIDQTKNTVGLTSTGTLSWNGRTVTHQGLIERLTYIGNLAVQPVILFQPDSEARYEQVDTVLADIRRAGVNSLGFVGNERYREF